MKNPINRAQDGQRKTFFPPVAKKKFSILTVIFLLSLCNTCLAQAVNKPSPDMVRHQIREGQVKEIRFPYQQYLDPIEFNKDGIEKRSKYYTRYLYDAHNRLSYRMSCQAADAWTLDTIIYDNEFDNRPLYRITGLSDNLKSIYFRNIKVQNCWSYIRFFYHGNECEPFASLDLELIADEPPFCYYDEYTYTNRDKYGNWTEMKVDRRTYLEISEDTILTLCNYKLDLKKRQQIEADIIDEVKKAIKTLEIKDPSLDDVFDYESYSTKNARKIIYY